MNNCLLCAAGNLISGFVILPSIPQTNTERKLLSLTSSTFSNQTVHSLAFVLEEQVEWNWNRFFLRKRRAILIFFVLFESCKNKIIVIEHNHYSILFLWRMWWVLNKCVCLGMHRDLFTVLTKAYSFGCRLACTRWDGGEREGGMSKAFCMFRGLLPSRLRYLPKTKKEKQTENEKLNK